jgi:NAD(P)-dependent dehydrogenase (short-subunit alcohol dehydrogenase family)
MTPDNPFDLSGQVAIVTGSTKGIGRAIASRFAQHGAKVVVSSRKADACQEAADEINANWAQNGGVAMPFACHAGDKAKLQEMVDAALAKWGRIDICVPCAGVNPYYGPSIDMPDSALDKIFEVNVKAVYWLCHMCLPNMVARGSGNIIIMASVAGLKGNKTIGAYAVSKVAEHQIARNFAMEYGPQGIRANAIAPGVIKTDFSTALWTDPERMAPINNAIPLRRLGEADEVAGVALFLASKASSYMTGQVLNVCGGAAIT